MPPTARLSVIEVIADGQIVAANDALEDWKGVAPDLHIEEKEETE